MSKKELNVEEIEVVESEEITEETKEPGKVAKSWNFVKKHWKKGLIGAGIFVGGLIVGGLSNHSDCSESHEDCEVEDLEIVDEDSVASDDVTE